MTIIGVVGDWHGNAIYSNAMLRAMAAQGITTVMHVGDFGIGWPRHGQGYARFIDQVCEELGITLYITPGNHENWAYINALPYLNGQAWIGEKIAVLERNTRFEMDGRSFLSLGGAPSIDFPARIPGHTWWPEEMLTLEDVEEAAAGGYVDIMLTHDAPPGGTDEVQKILDNDGSFWTPQGLAYAREGQQLMKIAVDGVKPAMFIHGHFHVAGEKVQSDTLFVSLDRDADRPGQRTRNGILLDLNTLQFDWIEVAFPTRVEA